MKAKLSLVIAIIFLSLTTSINAQTTEFTYQGRLTDNASPANGTYQMRFSLFDAQFGGTQNGSTIELTNVNVSNGVFTVGLNFGTDPFSFGAIRYLQIEVRRDAGEVYTPLNPRQELTSTPFAIRTILANAAENAYRLGNVDANQFVQTNDPRLSDARTPTAGSNFYIQNGTSTQTGSNFDISGTGESSIFNARTQFNFNGNRILSSPGTNNTFVGINAGTDLTSGDSNTFIGRNAGTNTTDGRTNTFVGSGAGVDNISGSSNSFFGFNSGLRVTSGTQNSFFGVSAGSGNLVGGQNSFFGYEAGLITTAGNNSFFGTNSGRVNTSGTSNSFFGLNAGLANTIGNNNTAIGADADFGTDNLSFATAIGSGAVVSRSNNVVLGRSNDQVMVPGTFSVIKDGGPNITRGDFNIIDDGTGNATLYMQSGSGNQGIAFSLAPDGSLTVTHNTDTGSSNFLTIEEDGKIRVVGPLALIRLGTSGSTDLCKNVGTAEISTCSSSLRYKTNLKPFNSGLKFIRQLKPISYDWKVGGNRDIGFGAEDVEKINPLFVTYNEDGQVEGVKYKQMSVLFVNAFKEQQTQIETQAEENKQLQEKVKSQQKQLDEQKQLIENLRMLVCTDKPEAEICQAEKEEKEDEK